MRHRTGSRLPRAGCRAGAVGLRRGRRATTGGGHRRQSADADRERQRGRRATRTRHGKFAPVHARERRRRARPGARRRRPAGRRRRLRRRRGHREAKVDAGDGEVPAVPAATAARQAQLDPEQARDGCASSPQCMRDNGVPNFPDPDPDGGIGMIRTSAAATRATRRSRPPREVREVPADRPSGASTKCRAGVKRRSARRRVAAAAGGGRRRCGRRGRGRLRSAVTRVRPTAGAAAAGKTADRSPGRPWSTRETVDGDARLRRPRPSPPRAHGGTVTWLPPTGAHASSAASRCTGWTTLPVVLLYGELPLYRPLSAGRRGRRRRAVRGEPARARATRVHRRTTSTPSATADGGRGVAGRPRPGRDRRGRAGQVVVRAPAAVRVDGHEAAVGDPAQPGAAVLTYTGATRVVTVDLDVDDQRLAQGGRDGRPSTLPDGKPVGGQDRQRRRRWSRRRPAGEQEPAARRSRSRSRSPTRAALGRLRPGPGATSRFTAAERQDVLTVPVAALLALAEGGYGVAGRRRRHAPGSWRSRPACSPTAGSRSPATGSPRA